MGPKKDDKNYKKLEAQNSRVDENSIGLPRLVARVWGLIAGISFISNGGYLLSESLDNKCQGAGAYMIFIGFLTMIFECACCLCPTKNNICDAFERKLPYWIKGLAYILCVIPELALCFGIKTLISSVIMIMLGILYIFLTCLLRSKKYERLQGEYRQRYKEQRQKAQASYSAFSAVTDTYDNMKKAAAAQKNKERQHRGKPSGNKNKNQSSKKKVKYYSNAQSA